MSDPIKDIPPALLDAVESVLNFNEATSFSINMDKEALNLVGPKAKLWDAGTGGVMKRANSLEYSGEIKGRKVTFLFQPKKGKKYPSTYFLYANIGSAIDGTAVYPKDPVEIEPAYMNDNFLEVNLGELKEVIKDVIKKTK